MIVIESRKKKRETLRRKYPNAIFADVTSKAKNALIRVSPFFPCGDIPVPFSPYYTSFSVEGIWQGLKVFSSHDIDVSLFKNNTMKGLKRSVRKYGQIVGHRKGVNGEEILDYIEARKKIYIPSYRWMLEHKAMDIVTRLREASKEQTIVLLDYNTNCDIEDCKKPLSHAYLLKAYAEGLYPYEDVLEHTKQHHVYVGRKTIEWDTETIKYKEPSLKKESQLTIDFDF